MSKKQWMALLMLFLIYLLLGASIFYHIESRFEAEKITRDKQQRIEINALLHEHYVPNGSHDQHEILEKLSQYCGKSVHNYTEGEVDRLRWDFYNSFYFAYTVVSTIGYGNLAPTNMLSRILMIFYGLVGIPMNGILLSQLGEFFSLVFIRAHRKYKSYKHGQCDHSVKKSTSFETRKLGLAAQIFVYLTPGFVMFIFFPAFLFSHYEGWTYDQSVYYAFVTLTTIGFGDIVAGQDNTRGSGPFFIIYKTFLICWISFGLGYIVMIMTFIARGMRSKKITRLEHKLAINLKHTQSKIWNEFNKEVDYLRRVFNELQLSKVKRVYVDEYDYEIPPAKFLRSNSFPDLRNLVMGGCTDKYVLPYLRRRANSEVVPTDQLTRVVSETDLQRIDKNATFATHAIVQPAELLARLVNILGYIPPPLSPDDANDWEQNEEDQPSQADAPNNHYKTIDSFSSAKQNLPNVSQWRIGNDKSPFAKPRSRATSEVRLQVKNDDSSVHQEKTEWTWSGSMASKKLQELIKARDTSQPASKDGSNKYCKFPSFALPISATKNLFPKWRKQFSNKIPSDVGFNAKSTDEIIMNDNEKSDQQSNSIGPIGPSPLYLDEKHSSISKRPYYTHTGGNLSSYLEGNNLLEETSLADFLRALTTLHARAGTISDESTARPKRKLGTASLTPPKLPSLFTLFSPDSPASGSATQSNQNTITKAQSHHSSRRLSLKTYEDTYSESTTPSHLRKESVFAKPRFSLKPVATPNMHSQQTDDRNLQESYVSTEPFISISSKEPLVNMEGPPGISSPIKPLFSNPRFSIRPSQFVTQPSPTSTKSMPTPLQTPKPLPKWKAGMLQRQLGQINLRNRVRAFSLSDVYSSRREKNIVPISPLAVDNINKTATDNAKTDVNKTSQKTVTIISPTEEKNMTSENESLCDIVISMVPDSLKDEQPSLRKNPKDAISSINPFVFEISGKPPAALNKLVISRLEATRRHCQEDGNCETTSVPVYKKSMSSEEKIVFEQRLVNLNDTVNKSDKIEVQETSTDIKEAPYDAKKTQNYANKCVIGNLDQLQESSNLKSLTNSNGSPGSSRNKPSVSIDFYKPQLQITIDKPAVNPFEQYRAITKSDKKKDRIKEDADLKEVRVEKFGET